MYTSFSLEYKQLTHTFLQYVSTYILHVNVYTEEKGVLKFLRLNRLSSLYDDDLVVYEELWNKIIMSYKSLK